MVQPKTIGELVTQDATDASARRDDLQVMVPVKNEVRKVEAFHATPTANAVSEIITEGNSSFSFLRLARLVITDGATNLKRVLNEEEAV